MLSASGAWPYSSGACLHITQNHGCMYYPKTQQDSWGQKGDLLVYIPDACKKLSDFFIGLFRFSGSRVYCIAYRLLFLLFVCIFLFLGKFYIPSLYTFYELDTLELNSEATVWDHMVHKNTDVVRANQVLIINTWHNSWICLFDA